MALIVQKYGGTSVGNIERIHRVAERVERAQKDGHQVVVVLSAMSGETDRLLKLAHEATSSPDERELDMLLSTGERVTIALLAMELRGRGVNARSFTGRQVGIHTDSAHTKARISRVTAERITEALAAGVIPVVAGFQGINASSDVTTLGRGGSDLTAVALAAALKADRCIIYTDVDGVYTADPKKDPSATRYSKLTFDEVFREIQEAADIFGVSADDLLAAQREELSQITRDDRGLTALWYSSGTDIPYVGAGLGAPQLVLETAGLANIAGDIDMTWSSYGWESIVAADPDVIVLIDADWNTAASKIELLAGNPATAALSAVAKSPAALWGLLGLAFDPTGERLYVHYTNANADNRLVEYTMSGGGSGSTVDLTTRRVVLAVHQPPSYHKGGDVAFGPDGRRGLSGGRARRGGGQGRQVAPGRLPIARRAQQAVQDHERRAARAAQIDMKERNTHAPSSG